MLVLATPLQATPQAGQQAPQGLKQELKLADIHLPAKPSAWPPAPGWWILFFLLLALVIFGILKTIRYMRLKKQQKLVFKSLDQLEKKLNQDQGTEAIANINILLRRLALAHYPRKQIASLTGKEWLTFLDYSGNTKEFSQGAGKLLADAPYLANVPKTADIQGLNVVVRKWVKRIVTKKQGRAH